jgi:hypothetical protein
MRAIILIFQMVSCVYGFTGTVYAGEAEKGPDISWPVSAVLVRSA